MYDTSSATLTVVAVLVSEAEAEVLYKALRSGKTMPEYERCTCSRVAPLLTYRTWLQE